MVWHVEIHPEFKAEIDGYTEAVRVALYARANLLAEFGPQLGRPYVDTLKGGKTPNLKETRFDADDGVWRMAFAFDPKRQAILLCAGDKTGVAQARFYKRLVKLADKRFAEHLKGRG